MSFDKNAYAIHVAIVSIYLELYQLAFNGGIVFRTYRT